MHHRFIANRNVGYTAHSAAFVDEDVLDKIPTIRIRDGVNLALPHVDFGVRGETSGQRAGEVVGPDRVQLVGDLVRQGAAFNRRKDSAGVGENMSVGREIVVMDGTLTPLFAECFRNSFRTDPAIAIPLRPAVPQPHPCTMPEPRNQWSLLSSMPRIKFVPLRK